MPERDEEGFLMRWSRRKRAAAKLTDERQTAVDDGTPIEAGSAPPLASIDDFHYPTSRSDESSAEVVASDEAVECGSDTISAELENIDIDSLNYDSDFTRFLGEGVPEALKRRALRQLWR